jgi:hypothetical protein
MIVLRNIDEPLVRRDRRWFCVPIIQLTTFVLAFLFAIGSVFAQAQQINNGPDKIRGTVVNAVTHQPISRALVHSPDNRFAVLTDGEGNFEFTLPKVESDGSGMALGRPSMVFFGENPNGVSLWLMARKPGFLDDPNETSQIEASPGRQVTISLMPEALIKGRVTLSTTEAATGVNVQIFSRQVQDGTPRWIPALSVRANSNGEFRFAELLPGAYKVVTHELMDNDPVSTVRGGQLYGFPPVYYPSATDFAAASTIQLGAGQTFQADLSLVHHPYYPVTIPVTNAELNSGINITVSLQETRSPGYSLGFNATKQRIEGLLPNGNYLVEAATFGPNAATGVVNLAVAGAPAEGPNMVLTRNSSITVNVKEEFTATWDGSASWSDGKHNFPLRGPRVYLNARAEAVDDFAQSSGGIRQPSGPNDDSLVLEPLSPGRYWLRLSSPRGYVASATIGGVDLLHQPFVVGSGSNTPIEVTMRDDSAEVEGTVAGIASASVTGEPGHLGSSTPSAYLYWVPLPDSRGQFLECNASPDGKFSSQTVAPGTYRVLAFKSRQTNLPYRDAEAMRPYETKGQVVHLSPGQKANLQLQLISSSE